MKQLEKNTPLFFKRLPKTEDSPADAVYLRFLGDAPAAGPAHEILWRGEKWIVRDIDILTHREALVEAAKRWQRKIDDARKPGMKIEQIALALQISVGTLRDKMKLVRNHLPTQPEAA
jgi:hypothetical protein